MKTLSYVQREARRIAEAVLGKPLPPGAEVHHVDEDPFNNKSSNLVICEDRAYHWLLHQRMRALKACGHVNWRPCSICGKYDDPVNLIIKRFRLGTTIRHQACKQQYEKQYYKEHRERLIQQAVEGKKKRKEQQKVLHAVDTFLKDLANSDTECASKT